MEARFDFDPVRANAAILRMKGARAGAVTMQGEDWTQGAMGALVHAEILAAQAGVVPWLELPDGSKGVLAIGAARERIANAPADVRTLYLATHRMVRATHASAAEATGSAPALGEPGEDLGEPISLTVALVVLGVAAILGAAWYFTRRAEIEVEGRNVRTTALVAEATRLGHTQLAMTGKIDPEVWEMFKQIADDEAGAPWVPVAVAGVVVLGGVGGYVAWRHIRTRERGAA